eukprot:13450_1
MMACWPRNAQNKNCPHRYKRFPAEVIEQNTDSTYKLRYKVSPYLGTPLLRPQTFPEDYDVLADDTNKNGSRYAPTPDQCFAESVREMWVQYPAQFVVDEIEQLEESLGPPFYVKYRAELCANWSNKKVMEWLHDIGLGEHKTLVRLVELNKSNGKHLLQIEAQNDKELRAELNELFVRREEEDDDESNNDKKTVELPDDFQHLHQHYQHRHSFASIITAMSSFRSLTSGWIPTCRPLSSTINSLCHLKNLTSRSTTRSFRNHCHEPQIRIYNPKALSIGSNTIQSPSLPNLRMTNCIHDLYWQE